METDRQRIFGVVQLAEGDELESNILRVVENYGAGAASKSATYLALFGGKLILRSEPCPKLGSSPTVRSAST